MVHQTQVLLILKAGSFRLFFPAGAAICFLLLACGKEPAATADVKANENDPVMAAHNIEVLFSDSGKVEARLTSPLMNRYAGESPFLEFPDGFKVTMFDSLQQTATTITANRGVRREFARTMEAWGNVIVRNEQKNEQLNTEHLVWDEGKHTIWTDVKVKITKPDQVLNGLRMESNETFTNYTIQQPTGLMNVKKDSL